MSALRVESWTMPAAGMGDLNPHPQFRVQMANAVTGRDKVDPRIPDEDCKHIGYGGHSTCVPYKMQDRYDCGRKPRAFEAVVLENEFLKAVFLPELGGRLWSLWHKRAKRELLFANPVFQPGNLAVRGAWSSGGVEWNFGVPGHTPFTCDRLFAARTALDDGTPVLRMYEYERVRGMAYQLDCFLPDDSEVLYVRVALRNPHDRTVPAYWWSNIAVPEARGHRVMMPAETFYSYSYNCGFLSMFDYPMVRGVDRSYPTSYPNAADGFFNIPSARQPWIASIDETGCGLFQASTSVLRGRKLWVWGQCRGSTRWQDFLNTPGRPYIELQAGLERTQSACRPLPGGESFEFLEAYGLAETDPAITHGSNWPAAWKHAGARIALLAPSDRMEEKLAGTRAMSLAAPLEVLKTASGWGALERRRRERSGERPFAGPSAVFPDSTIGPDQAPWLELMEKGALPDQPPSREPASFMIQAEWQRMLEHSQAQGRSGHWLAWLQLGIMHQVAGREAEACAAWEKSVALSDNVWARRNLGRVVAFAKRWDEAELHFRRALALAPEDRRVASEYSGFLIEAGRPAELRTWVKSLTPAMRDNTRIHLMEARAAVDLGFLDEAASLLAYEFNMAALPEGDTVPTNIWFDLQAKLVSTREGVPVTPDLMKRVRRESPPPAHLDFRGSDEQ